MKKLLIALTAAIALWSCESEKVYQADYILEVESVTLVEGNWSLDDDSYLLNDQQGWLAFDLNIDEPGRYKVEVIAEGKGTVWIEDYYANDDGRTYNITGNIVFNSEDEQLKGKEGSPLNSGRHPMKLHASGSNLEIDKVLITKMMDHQITPVSMEQSYVGDEWQLVWSDEFDGMGKPDSTKWIYDIGDWGWGNNEPQYYTQGRSENARVENGNLIIEAHKNDLGKEWTSARLTTRGRASFLYGKIEFRAKVPSGDGTWAAGWLLGDEYVDELSWPYCGEIDVLETTGKEIDDETGNGLNHASCHTRTYYFKEGTQITSEIEVENLENEFHTYGIEWTPEGIIAYLDGNYYYTYDKTQDELEWPFDKPQNIILNLAIGGGMGGAIDPSLQSAQLVVDYVRVYGKR